MKKIIKVVKIAVGCVKTYPLSAWRVVQCLPHQKGYASERGVRIIWESEGLYRPLAGPRSKGYAARQKAERIAEESRRSLMV